MKIEILMLIGTGVLFLIILYSFITVVINNRKIERKKICFKDGFIKCEHPILYIKILGKEYTFLVDSGANVNYIDSAIIEELLEYSPIELKKSLNVITGSGEICDLKEVNINFNIKGVKKEFKEKFTVMNLSKNLEIIGREHGIKLQGIIGSKFLDKHRWNLDYKELVFWI